MFAAIDARPAHRRPPGAAAAEGAPDGGAVSFRDVGFAYQADAGPTLDRRRSSTFPPAQKIALVGPSGAGKSTIFNLLLRFYDAGQRRDRH